MSSNTYGYSVGDKVVRKQQWLSNWGYGFDRDNGPFTVQRLEPFEVTLDRAPAWYSELPVFSADRFEKYVESVAPVVPRKPEYVIALRSVTGELAPATSPRIYTSEPQAKAVAHSMANKHVGQKFVILKAVGEAYAPPTQQSVVEMY